MIVFFFGPSGVGKSSIANELGQLKPFQQPRMTVTRSRRLDDRIDLMEYVQPDGFAAEVSKGSFLVYAGDNNRFYGYKKERIDLHCRNIFILMGCPPYAFNPISYPCLNVLIDGNEEKGLQIREKGSDLVGERNQLNVCLNQQYYQNPTFRQKMHLIIKNQFIEGPKWQEIFTNHVRLIATKLFFNTQQYFAHYRKEIKSMLWLARFYTLQSTYRCEKIARIWMKRSLSLGYMPPFSSNVYFDHGKSIASTKTLIWQAIQNDRLSTKKIIVALFTLSSAGKICLTNLVVCRCLGWNGLPS